MIHARMASTAEMLACFSDEALLDAALRFERELAAAQADHGVISHEAAEAIAAACEPLDRRELGEAAALAGTLAIPLVARLRTGLGDAAAAVHFGATSQDLADTALALQARQARLLLEEELGALRTALVHLALLHARTPTLGRTLLQPAEPLTLGMRFATWLLAFDEATTRLTREALHAERIQYGGPVGSLAALHPWGPTIRAALAIRLGLRDSPSWHARRGSLAGLGAALAILTGAAAKMARDVSLLMQPPSEVSEPRVPGRGGSSSMAHKHNPTACQIALAAATRAPHLAATLLASLPQELERGLGNWQAEAPVLADLFALTHGALRAMRQVAQALEITPSPPPHTEADLDAAERFVHEALRLLEKPAS